MKSKILGLLAVGLLAGPMAASATATVTTGACTVNAGTCATGINGLDVGGTLYDVSFQLYGSYDTIYAASPSPFLGDQAGAFAATVAILNVLSATSLDGAIANADYTDYFLVPYKLHGPADIAPGYVDIVYGYNFGPATGSNDWFAAYDCAGGFGCLEAALDYSSAALLPIEAYIWTVFTIAVPEPGTLALLGLGLAGLGLSRRRKA